MSNKLIGTDPNQVPSNADLGTLAYQDADSANLGTLLVTDRIGIDTNGTDTLNSPYLFTVADESHGVAIDYVSAYPTTPGGLFSTAGGSTWPFNQYGNMILTTRTDYGGYYDIALVTASTNNTPVARLVVKHSGNVGIGTTSPDAWLQIEKDNNNSGNQFSVADTEGASAAIRTYSVPGSSGDPAGLILNHYYAQAGSGNEYMRYADIVANVGNGAGTTMRFITKNAANTYSVGLAQDNNGNVGIGTTVPKATLHVETPGNSDGFAVGGKNIGMNTTFQTGAQLEITLGNHQACYVKVFITGDWSGHSAVAFLGEYFVQNGADAYAEAGMIIREVDNTAGPVGDHVSSMIYDGGNYDSFQIQFKLNALSGGVTSMTAALTYQVMGQFDAIT
tara:strand:- start:768 stop:1940 length:1173 start_codon:yes stop_codon:yes gene_type:complete